MALTDEQVLQQLNVLTEKTSDNASMKYTKAARTNKGLNPEKFSSYNSKIVNAINLLYSDSLKIQADAATSTQMINDVMGSTSVAENQTVWNSVVEILTNIKPAYKNMIYASKAILTGEAISQILQVSKEDKGKLLSIDLDEENNVIIKTVPAGSGGSITSLDASAVTYSNTNITSLTNVKEAIDYMLTNNVSEINWENIKNKPDLADGLGLTDTALVLKSGEKDMSTVELMNETDVTEIVSAL
nr:MAG TPA: hypothetical protein [Caudoviricetes sp.]